MHHEPAPLTPLQVSIKRAAELLGYSQATIYNLIQRGELRSVGTGRLRRIPLSELKRWQEHNMR